MLAKRAKAKMQLANAGIKLKRDQSQLLSREEAVKTETDLENKSRIANVALRVKYESAKHAQLHAQFMKLKAKGLSKLAVAKSANELAKKKKRHSINDVKSAREMLKIMASGPGAKAAKASLKKAQQQLKKNSKNYEKAHKDVGKVTKAIWKTEKDWAKKMAYNAVMKTARLSAKSLKADKAFSAALSEADKQAKKLTADQTRQELKKATKNAERKNANYEHVKFAAAQAKKGRAEDHKRELAKEKENRTKEKKRKAERK